jgi:hypothetical protein
MNIRPWQERAISKGLPGWQASRTVYFHFARFSFSAAAIDRVPCPEICGFKR